MKMKLAEVKRYLDVLRHFIDKMLPRKVTTAIARNVGKLEKEVEFFEKQRFDIINRYAVKDEDGTFVIEDDKYTFASKEDEKAFLEELEQLGSTEVEVELMKFHASELERCDIVERYAVITPREELALEFMIDYE